MTLPLRRCAVNLTWVAVCISFLSFIFVATAGAQGPSTQSRAAPPPKVRSVAKVRHASSWVANPNVNGKDSYLIVDASSGRELASDQPDSPRHPASLTKLMTLYLTFSALDSGRLSLGDALPVSVTAANAPPTKMGMQPGGTVVVRDAIMGLVTRSANDAAVLLGETLGGDEESFARMMTQKARQLGMSSTVFRNASGLPNREQVTTARDMAKLANALLRDFPHYYPVFSVQSYVYHGRPLDNHNHMLGNYPGADGLKTGYTAASGFNLVMSAIRDNRRLIGVVMGGDSPVQRDRLMAELMDRGFASAQAMNLSPWTSPRTPPSARYSAANFVPGSAIPVVQAVRAEQSVAPAVQPAAAVRVASAAATIENTTPPVGSWVIQVGSFADARSAQLALERATAILPDVIRAHGAATVDEVQMAQKTFHRARLTNLSQGEAIDGCKRLEQRKIYCSALQVTAWNTPGAR
ncbi:D-alanyl-D-alanine carboxypeptidase [Enhydrobacter aerosaccus]|uniref:D-alanyl-D-alanine carboxypeptidase n=1 Tax=Enhydrobacter aerosaccus TaxID=225324 RepID=A0A1T4LRX8_9HYPH|nr:D-alanyl-D-alanine carboxypeptidase family protein [Enhydrobacter aerosaccus]SJZ57204.1 D-alanyl-D-alanine carboxypeptidase [Enhydrobacter aerosaccus]